MIENRVCEEIKESEDIFYNLEKEFSKKDTKKIKRNYHDSLKVINRKKLDKKLKSNKKIGFDLVDVDDTFYEIEKLEVDSYLNKKNNSKKISKIEDISRLKIIFEILDILKIQKGILNSQEYNELSEVSNYKKEYISLTNKCYVLFNEILDGNFIDSDDYNKLISSFDELCKDMLVYYNDYLKYNNTKKLNKYMDDIVQNELKVLGLKRKLSLLR